MNSREFFHSGLVVKAILTGIALTASAMTVTAPAQASSPLATTLNAVEVGDNSARLRGAIDTGGEPTRYQFEYGTDTGYGNSAPANPAVAGLAGSATVSRLITGLRPNTTYHFRLNAINGSGEGAGSDLALTTGASGEAGRAYEQATPVDKGGSDLVSIFADTQNRTLPDGSAVTYAAGGTFAGAQASLQSTTYRSVRGAEEWTTTPISVPQENRGQIMPGDTILVSDDLSHSVVTTYRELTPDSPAGEFHVYLQDNDTGRLTRLYSRPIPVWDDLQVAAAAFGGTPSFDHVVFSTPEAVVPDAPDNGKSKLYEYTDGETRLVSVLPDGNTNPNDDVPSEDWVVTRYSDLSDMISDDGRKIFFTLGSYGGDNEGSFGSYVRIDGEETIPMSVSERVGDDPATVLPSIYTSSSADGRFGFFTSPNPLTNDASEGPYNATQGGVLYRFDTQERDLIAVTPGPVDPAVDYQSVISDETGAYVAFRASGSLDPEAPGQAGAYIAHAGEVELAASGSFFGGLTMYLAAEGGHLAIGTNEQISSYDNQGTNQVYGYSVGGELRCLSCPDAPPIGDAYFSKSSITNPVADDGRITFTSPERLAYGDINGQEDVYIDDGTEGRLISSGRSAQRSFLITMTPDAKDVFFATTDQLVTQDRDALYDVYTAKVGGGLPAQDPPPPAAGCDGDGCQQPPTHAPAVEEPGSSQVSGSGNPTPAGDCAALQRRAKKVKRQSRSLRERARKADGKRVRKLRKRATRKADRARALTARARACEEGDR